MGFLKPKPPMMPTLPTPPVVPPVISDDLPDSTKDKIDAALKNKTKGYTETIMTSNQGDTSDVKTKKKTLLGA